MVIITGLGRCGTSILTKYLKEVGYGIGYNVNWHDEVRAGYELTTFYSIIDDLYQYYCKKGKKINLSDKINWHYWKGRSYREALNLFDKDHRQGKVDLVKDPRITWHPDIIEAIWEVRQDFELLICHRNIQAIEQSRLNLPVQYQDPKPRKTITDYQVDFAEFYTRVLELEITHRILFFPDFLKDYYYLHQSLATIFPNYDYEKGKEVYNRIIDKDLLSGT